ncbi:MAG TPA: FHA domain-containing protein [Propionibacteriaceae bacterium]
MFATRRCPITAVERTPVAIPDVPYRGIQPFRYRDHPIFLSRGDETRRLLHRVVVYRGVLLYGESGAGKSSLVNAGLFPVAEQAGFRPERLRVQPRQGEELVLERIPVTADGSSFLSSSFAEEGDPSQRAVLSLQSFRDGIERLPGDARPLLIFDQFEELITLFEEAGPEGALEIQRQVVRLLVELIRDETLPLKLVFVFREDYLARVKELLAERPEVVDQSLRLMTPSSDVLYDLIRGPFERYPGHFGSELSPELSRDLVAAVNARSGHGPLNLSEVQTVCLRLWQADDPESLFYRRGVQGVLEDYVWESLERFPDDLRYGAIALLGQMVTSSGTRNVISAQDLIERVRLEEGEDIPEERLEQALEALEGETRLVRRERRRDLYLYEITSEFLVPWIARRREELIRAQERIRERRKLRRRIQQVLAILLMLTVLGSSLWLYRSWLDNRPWATFGDLSTGQVHQLTGAQAYIGRNAPNYPQSEVDLRTRYVSRLHFWIRRDLNAIDLRSLNGTTVNGRFLEYGKTVTLRSGDIVALGGIGPFRIERLQPSPFPFLGSSVKNGRPASGWAILLDGATRTTTELTSDRYFLAVRNGAMALSTRRQPDTVGDVRRVEGGAVLTGNLSLQAKQNDYTYRTFKLSNPGSRFLFPCSPCPYVFFAGGLPFQVLIRNPPEAPSDRESG